MKPPTAGRILTALLLVIAAAIAACSGRSDRRSPRVPVVVAQVERRSVPYEVEATGTVEPVQSARVTSQVVGLITRVSFREGDEVRAGQVLFHIDPRPFAAAVDRAAAALARDRAQADAAQSELKRAEALAEQKLIAAGELDKKRAEAVSLAATVRAEAAALVSARLDRANATIRAPISGKTGHLFVHVGDLAKANDPASPLVTINQIRPIRVRFTVPQADLGELRRRQRENLRVNVASGGPDSAWTEGRLVFVDNAVDPESGTLMLKAEFPNREGGLWPGEFMRVRLRLYEQVDATVVPAAAVANSQTGSYCYVVKPDTTVEVRPVQIGRTWRELTVIASGLQPGETVVTDGQIRLSPGAKAVIRETGLETSEASR